MVELRTVLPALLAGLALLIWYLRAVRRFTTGRLLMVAGLGIYLIQVSYYTIFPLRLDPSYIDTFRSKTRLMDGVNIVPFKGLTFRSLADVQGWGNIVLGVPFGFLSPFVALVSNWRRMALRGLLFGSTIELVQLLISVPYGFAYRIIDINDVMLNFAGVMLGYAFLKCMASLYRMATGDKADLQTRSDGSWSHIRSVLLAQAARR